MTEQTRWRPARSAASLRAALWFFGFSIALLPALAPAARASNSVGVTRCTAAGVPVMVVSVNMNDLNVKVTGLVARAGSAESFSSMIKRSHPTAAVTGTFFSMRSRIPIGDIVVDGEMAHKGGVGTGLCITGNNDCEFIKPPRRYAKMDWGQYDFVCCAGPRLVVNGKASVHPGAEGFRDPGLLGRAPRLAVGITKYKKLLFVATRSRIQLGQLAKAMKQLGCVNAINLDAGGSLGVYHRGKMLAQPGRRLTNVILIYDDTERYERFKSRLTPRASAQR